MLFSRKIDPIALDIGSTHIKVVQLKGSAKSYSLAKFGMVPLPPEVIVEGAVMDANRVSEAIKELLADQKIKTKEVVLGPRGAIVMPSTGSGSRCSPISSRAGAGAMSVRPCAG